MGKGLVRSKVLIIRKELITKVQLTKTVLFYKSISATKSTKVSKANYYALKLTKSNKTLLIIYKKGDYVDNIRRNPTKKLTSLWGFFS